MTGEVVVVANGSLSTDLVGAAKDIFDSLPVEVTWANTSRADAGTEVARAAVANGAGVVIAFGGDGTVRACAEGVSGTDTCLGVIPAGTGNLLARNLGIPGDLESSIAVATGEHTRVLDTGRVNGELFVVIAGAGFDAEVMADTDDKVKDLIGSLAYFIEGARHLSDPSFEATISVDGADVARDTWATVLVGNLSRLQGGVELFPESSPDDGVLEVLGVSADTPVDRLTAGFEAVRGDGMGEHLLRAKGRDVHIELARPTRYELDGDARPPASVLDFEISPQSLEILSPE